MARLLPSLALVMVFAISGSAQKPTKPTAGAAFHVTAAGYVADVFTDHASSAFTRGKRFWGAQPKLSAKCPCVKELRIRTGKTVVEVPMSAYVDLSNVYEVVAKPAAGGVTIEIRGGDAAESYHCTITLKGGKVVTRRVEHGEFPDNFNETTNYVSNPPNN